MTIARYSVQGVKNPQLYGRTKSGKEIKLNSVQLLDGKKHLMSFVDRYGRQVSNVGPSGEAHLFSTRNRASGRGPKVLAASAKYPAKKTTNRKLSDAVKAFVVFQANQRKRHKGITRAEISEKWAVQKSKPSFVKKLADSYALRARPTGAYAKRKPAPKRALAKKAAPKKRAG